MSTEVKSLAVLALQNAFYQDFSALVNGYLKASKGLADSAVVEQALGEVTSIHGRQDDAAGDDSLNIWTQHATGATVGHESMQEALEDTLATEIHLRGSKVFERQGDDWYFIGDQNSHPAPSPK